LISKQRKSNTDPSPSKVLHLPTHKKACGLPIIIGKNIEKKESNNNTDYIIITQTFGVTLGSKSIRILDIFFHTEKKL